MLAGQHGSTGCRWALSALGVAAALSFLAAGAQEPRALGGCHTTEREYGLPALRDSLAARALAELTAPGTGPKTGPACAALRVDAPLFVTIGAVNPPSDSLWVWIASRVAERMRECEIRLAVRSPLRLTTGTCFPPYHVDLEAVGESAEVQQFMKGLPHGSWGARVVASGRAERAAFVAAGMSRESTDAVVDLKLR